MDNAPGKVRAYNAMAAAKGLRPAELADICDAARYSPAFFESLGRVDLLVCAIPCKDFSTAGKGAGIAAPRTGSFFEGLIRWVGLSRPALVMLECVKQLATASAAKRARNAAARARRAEAAGGGSPAAATAAAGGGRGRAGEASPGPGAKRARSQSRSRAPASGEDGDDDEHPDIERLLAPLRALGYDCRVGTRKADEWVAMRRERLVVLVYRRDHAGAHGAYLAPDETFGLAVSPSAQGDARQRHPAALRRGEGGGLRRLGRAGDEPALRALLVLLGQQAGRRDRARARAIEALRPRRGAPAAVAQGPHARGH